MDRHPLYLRETVVKSTSTPEVLKTRVLHEGPPAAYLDVVRFPDGPTARFLRVDMGESAQVLAVNQRREILFVEGYRHGVGRVALTLPAGVAKLGETPRETARRELLEETGYAAKSLRKLLTMNTLPGYLQGRLHVFLAGELRRTRKDIDHREIDRVRFVPMRMALDLIRRGELSASTVATILYAREGEIV